MRFTTSSQHIQGLGASIGKILQISGGAGASIGIFNGRTNETHIANFGDRDVPAGIAPDEHTIYHLASLSKSFTAVSIALLAADGKMKLDDRMCDVLPSFHHYDDTIAKQSTVLDFLSHRTGLASKNAVWQQDGREVLLYAKETVPTVSYLEVVKPLGEKYMYSNWHYDILSDVVESVSGMPFSQFLTERVLQPLGLNETTLSLEPATENWANGYMAGPDGKLTDVGRPEIAEGTAMQGADAVKSNIHDLLIYYKAVLDAWKHETGQAAGDGPATSSLLRRIKALLEPYIPLDPDAGPESGAQWYGAGWAGAELPAPLGNIGTNPMFVDMPLVGKGCKTKNGKKPTVWYHNGSLVGFFSSVHILPDSDLIIIVLTNAITKNDAADWIGQLLIEDLLGCEDKNDYLPLAEESAAGYDKMWEKLPGELEKLRTSGSLTRPPAEYAGRYFNKVKNFFIEVVRVGDGFEFRFQGRPSQTHKLRLLSEDCMEWLLTEAESRTAGRWPDLGIDTYLFHFEKDASGSIKTLRWVHDGDVPEGEKFEKNGPDASAHVEL